MEIKMKLIPKVDSVTSFLSIVYNKTTPKHIRCYRGQSSNHWTLKPSVMRGLRKNAEKEIFSELMTEAPGEFNGDRSMFDKLVRAQHYGLPTRLLDVSLNPLVALYFACDEQSHHDKDGVVHLLDFAEERVRFADSDTVSLICNLARLSDSEKDEIGQFIKIKKPSTEIEKFEFRELNAMKRLTQFIRVEKPYFTDTANHSDLLKYYFVHPAKNNRRVVAQSGAFVAAGLLKYEKAGSNGKGFALSKIVIPASSKELILEQLDVLNINSRTMFPEVEFVSRYIKRKWEIPNKL
jgi:hypothetical protein